MSDVDGIDRSQFLNPDFEELLKSVPIDTEQEWIWSLINTVREFFPEIDIYTAATPYIGFGIKRLTLQRGDLHFYVKRYNGHFRCYINFRKDQFSENFKQEITSDKDSSKESILTWVTELKEELTRLNVPVLGEGRNPVEYAEGIAEGDDELSKDHQSSHNTKNSENKMNIPKNQILYGAAGTGKTYHTINKALEILEPEFLMKCEKLVEGRGELKKCFDQLMADGRIRFVTFHQSFSYEDFVEGIRAKTEDGKLFYEPEDGVFKDICLAARTKATTSIEKPIDLKGRKVWKMSLGEYRKKSDIYDYAIANNMILLGWGDDVDYSDCKDMAQIKDKMKRDGSADYLVKYPSAASFVDRFKNRIKRGDLVIISEGNHKFRAIGEVTGDYENLSEGDESSEYMSKRDVKWLKVFDHGLPVDRLFKKVFSQQTVYQLHHPETLDIDKLGKLLEPEPIINESKRDDYVLIIDEINRGNISRIFGELITLIEESKREGADEALSVILPYSQNPFSVPDNVYIIGTMNSSDRSLTGLDIALRRRFTFIEMQPKPETLNHININGLNVGQLLSVINQRIEVLLDRDHCIGHAYFMPLEADPTTNKLSHIFQQKIMPLLQEYFYDDWERINWVLNENGMLIQKYQDVDKLFPKSAHGKLQNQCWKINPEAFDEILNYQNIIGVAQ